MDLEKCISCGACTEKCPSVVLDAYNAGLGKRKAIYKYYAQAIPSGYAIDAASCRQLGQGKKCGICAKNCPVHCIPGDRKSGYLIETDKCIRCGTCFEKCPFGAIEKK